jgi:hypothetical protein
MMKIIRSFVIAVTALALTGLGTAYATPELDGGLRPPAGWPFSAEQYVGLFGPAGELAPGGTVVADSGFRPYPNGFGFQNWGSNLNDNALLLGIPSRLSFEAYPKADVSEAPLNALALRRTFGDGVCISKSSINPKTGSCRLRSSARVLANLIQGQAAGGHCFGMAAATAALYNGQLPPNQLGGGLVPALAPLNEPAQQTITRLFGTQYFGAISPDVYEQWPSPTLVVEQLIRDLSSGTTPYVLILLGEIGGHGIVPYAVLDRGQGVFDIAVYDNNYPNQPRAVRVDTVAGTFAYNGATNPQATDFTWAGNNQDGGFLGLVPVNDILKEQVCPICPGPESGALIAFSAIKKENADGFDAVLLSPDGQPLSPSDYQVLPPSNPPNARTANLPIVIVKPGIPFVLAVNTKGMKSEQNIEVYAMAQGTTRYALLEAVKPDTVETFIYDPKTRDVALLSSKRGTPRLLISAEDAKFSHVVNAHLLRSAPNTAVEQAWNKSGKRVVYKADAKQPTRWNIQVEREGARSSAGYVAINQIVPRNASIVVDYGKWTANGPDVWIDRGSDGSLDERVTLQLITPALIKRYESSLYREQGIGQ